MQELLITADGSDINYRPARSCSAQEHRPQRSLSHGPITRLVGELIAAPDKIWVHIPSSVETCNMHGVLLLSLAYLGRGQSGAVGQFSLLPRRRIWIVRVPVPQY